MRIARYMCKVILLVLKGQQRQIHADGNNSTGRGIYEVGYNLDPEFNWEENLIQYWDNITGKPLPTDLVKKGREEEIKFMHDLGVYRAVGLTTRGLHLRLTAIQSHTR